MEPEVVKGVGEVGTGFASQACFLEDWLSFELPTRQHLVEGARLAHDEISHRIFIEESGIPDGVPVLVVHGGPGSVIPREAVEFLDPTVFRIIQIHQRGSGQSQPAGEMGANTLEHLLGDIELARSALTIESWHVFGWSWGSTLAVQYASAFPDIARSLTAYGVFLGSESEHQAYLENLAQYAPERYRAMQRVWDSEQGESPVGFFAQFLNLARDSEGRFDEVVRAWFERDADSPVTERDCERFRINLHYAANHYFLENKWWEDLSLPAKLPVTLIHGVHDHDVPVQSAIALSRVIKGSNLELIEAGHSLGYGNVQHHLREHYRHVIEDEYRKEFLRVLQ